MQLIKILNIINNVILVQKQMHQDKQKLKS